MKNTTSKIQYALSKKTTESEKNQPTEKYLNLIIKRIMHFRGANLINFCVGEYCNSNASYIVYRCSFTAWMQIGCASVQFGFQDGKNKKDISSLDILLIAVKPPTNDCDAKKKKTIKQRRKLPKIELNITFYFNASEIEHINYLKKKH